MGVEDDNIVIDRGIALHKMLRFLTLTLGGQAYLNFMGNEFGHPEWIDFPREGNNWSYFYARRQWSLKDNTDLKYHYLSDFDKAMISLSKEKGIQDYEFADQLNLDETNKTIIFSKNSLIFVFNFHPSKSIFDYSFNVSFPGTYRIVLCSDSKKFGGQGRIDELMEYPTFYNEELNKNTLRIYLTQRTAIVLERKM